MEKSLKYSKIKICNINIDDLKVLSEKERTNLFKKIKKLKSLEDLFQVACIGLIKSINNFNIDLGMKFSTYAVPMMIGEIKRHLRDNGSIRVSRILKSIAYKALREKEKIISKQKRHPTIKELAKIIDVSPENLAIALESVILPMSIYEPIAKVENGGILYLLDQLSDGESGEDWIKQIHINESINNLSERQKTILSLRFLKGQTQSEVAEEIGVSQAQISRLEQNALKKITRNKSRIRRKNKKPRLKNQDNNSSD